MIRGRFFLAGMWRLLSQGRARSELATRLAFSKRVHQDNSFTRPDRYPRLFAAARALLSDDPGLRILSFGCAAGEEVISLQRYFPEASIVGAELNRSLLRACRRLPSDPRRTFIASSHQSIAAEGPYDAIFCMAVFTRRPHEIEARGLRSIANFYPYAMFADELRFLAGQLRPGGLMVVEHGLYLAEDALAGLPVRAVEGPGTYLAKGPRFDPLGDLIEPQPVVSRIFRRDQAA
jgi:hypothetical protein